MKLHMKNPTQFIESLRFEKDRLKFLMARDGFIRTAEFVERTHKIYRQCRKHGHAQEGLFAAHFAMSCVEFRKFMRYFEMYQDYLTKVGQAKPKPKDTSVEKT